MFGRANRRSKLVLVKNSRRKKTTEPQPGEEKRKSTQAERKKNLKRGGGKLVNKKLQTCWQKTKKRKEGKGASQKTHRSQKKRKKGEGIIPKTQNPTGLDVPDRKKRGDGKKKVLTKNGGAQLRLLIERRGLCHEVGQQLVHARGLEQGHRENFRTNARE